MQSKVGAAIDIAIEVGLLGLGILLWTLPLDWHVLSG